MSIRAWYRRADYLRHEPLLVGLPRRPALLRAAVAPGERVLDVGCLGGALLAPAAQGAWVVGVDLIQPALVQAKARGLHPVQADAALPLPFREASFDLVHAGEVLEHLFHPLALLRELHRVTRPGGRIIGTVPNVANLADRLRLLVGKAPTVLGPHPDAPAGDHIRAFTVARLQDLLGEAGWASPARVEPIVTGGPLPLRLIEARRAHWADLIWFEVQRT
jgi:SAM-dependent methyltransferase